MRVLKNPISFFFLSQFESEFKPPSHWATGIYSAVIDGIPLQDLKSALKRRLGCPPSPQYPAHTVPCSSSGSAGSVPEWHRHLSWGSKPHGTRSSLLWCPMWSSPLRSCQLTEVLQPSRTHVLIERSTHFVSLS